MREPTHYSEVIDGKLVFHTHPEGDTSDCEGCNPFVQSRTIQSAVKTGKVPAETVRKAVEVVFKNKKITPGVVWKVEDVIVSGPFNMYIEPEDRELK